MGFYKGNSDEVIGAPARILYALYDDVAVATEIDDVIDTADASYPPQTGWNDLGFTSQETTITNQATMQVWTVQQVGDIKSVPVNWSAALASTAVEVDQAHRLVLLEADAAANVAGGKERVTHYSAKTSVKKYRVAAVWIDDREYLHMSFFPKCELDLSNITQRLGRGQMFDIPFNFKALTDEDAVSSVTNAGLFRMDFDRHTL